MSDEQRFDHYVKKTDGCWLWGGATFGVKRYGAFGYQRQTIGAHVFSYMRFKGPIDPGQYVCHTCDRPECVNPEHLFLGTPNDNTQDMLHKGRGKWPRGDKHHLAKLTDDQMTEIKALAATLPQKVVASLYGIDPSHVSRLVSGHKRGRVAAPEVGRT